jgi:hypothetical protein
MFVRTTRSFSARPAPTLPMSLPDAADQEEEQCVRAPSRYGNCEKSKIGKEYQTDHHYNKFRGLMAKTYVVVGGSAAGPKTASKIRRLDQEAKIIMMQKGKYLSMASCGYPYFVGGVFDDPNQLISTSTGAQRNPTFFSNVKNITALTSTEVLSIDRKKNASRRVTSKQGKPWTSRTTGCSWRRARIPSFPIFRDETRKA